MSRRGVSLGRVKVPMPRLLLGGSRWALAWVVLPLMVASDYKVRLRDKLASVSGSPDLFVLIEIAVYAVIAIVLVRTVARAPDHHRNTPLVNLAWVYAGYSAISALWSPYINLASVRGAQLLLEAAVAQSIARYARRDQLHGLAHAFTALVAVSVVFGKLVPFPPVSGQVAGRFTWLYVHPVISGIYVGAATVIMTAYLMRAARPHRIWPGWVYPVLLVIVAYGLLATRTRGSLIAAVVGIALLIAFGAKGRRRDIVATLAVLLTIALLTVTGTVLLYLSRGEPPAQLSSLNDRTSLWSLAFAAFDQKPLIGWGLTASRGIFFAAIGLGGGHNAFINALVDGGVIGATLWVSLLLGLVFSLRRLWRLVPGGRRAEVTLLTALVAYEVVNGLTAEGSAAPANVASILLFVLVGWTGALQRDRLLARAVVPARPVPDRRPVWL